LFELPLSFVAKANATPVVFSASHARGVYNDARSLYLLNEPAENTDHTVFLFNLTSDMSGVNIMRQQYGIRTTSSEDALAVQLGAWSGWVGTLPIVAINSAKSNPSVVVDASSLLAKGFFITSVSDATQARLNLAYCRSFPNNLDLTVEYQVGTYDN